MEKSDKIYVAGHVGLVGSALVRALKEKGFDNLVMRSHKDLDLMDQVKVNSFFEDEKPDYVFLAAAKVGGILANRDYPAEFIYNNLQIQNNVIHSAYLNKVKKLLFLGSSCIYPKNCQIPIKEDYLLTGLLESTNEPYAVAKICGIKMCQSYNRQYETNFIAVMPTNLYGLHDNFDLQTSHVLPALIRKFHEAKTQNKTEVVIWGTGKPRREFLYVDDMADGCLFLMENFDPTKEENENGKIFLNLGTGEDISIKELSELIKDVVGFQGEIICDTSKPDGVFRKVMDVSKMNNLGWRYNTDLKDGISIIYNWYLNNLCF